MRREGIYERERERKGETEGVEGGRSIANIFRKGV